jgi:hypothetical protein
MHCPTCDSPLPVGAMFCGVCGRAVTSADVAAAAARRDEGEGTGSGTVAQAEPPAWQLRQPPRPTTSGDAPWWVRDRRVEQEPVDQVPVGSAPVGSAPVGSAPDEAAPDRDRGDERAGGERRAVEAGAEEAPPAWIVPARSVETTGADATLVDREAAARARQDDPSPAEPVTESPSEVAQPAAPAPAPLPAEPVAPAAAPAPAPAPLRAPTPHADNGPRPTSAPLWTASFSRLPSEDHVPAPALHDETPPAARPTEDAVAAEAPGQEADPPVGVRQDGARPEGGGVVGSSAAADGDDPGDGHDSSAAGTPEISPARDETPGPADPAGPVLGADDGEDAAEPEPEAAPRPGPDASEPGQPSAVGPVLPVPLREPAPAPDGVAGDTAPVTPLPRAVPGASPAVAPVPDGDPVPLVEPGQQKVVEHCTHCGALLDEDDIFCPECGAVVQSVALSFTGPVAPLPPEWRPSAPAPAPAPTPAPASDPENVVDAGAEATPAVDERRAELPLERPADRPTAPPSEPPVQPGAVPGRWAGAPGGDGATGLPDLPPMPTAAPTSALSGLLAGDARSRLVTDDDVDETRLVRRGPVGTEYLFQFSTGESVTVDGSGLLGRAPSPQPGERFDHLVRIADPGKSVSKTHLEFGQELGALWVSDRWSGNGTVVRPHEQPARRVEPGTRVRVARGTRVEIGEQFFIVS